MALRRRRRHHRRALTIHHETHYGSKNYKLKGPVQSNALQFFYSTEMTSGVENELILAILTKDVSTVKSIIRDGFDVSNPDSHGNSPLHYAVFVGDVAITSVLLESGANINAQDSLGLSPLHRAISANNFDVAKLLVDKVKLMSRKLRVSPEMSISEICQETVVTPVDAQLCIMLLIAVTLSDNLGRTAMHFMACGGHIPMLSLLREGGASITVTDFYGRNVAHFAAMASQAELLGELLTINAMFASATDNNGYSPLHYAVQNAHNTKTIELNADGITPLHLASEWAKVSRVDSLLLGGAVIDPRSLNDATPLHCAALAGHQLVVKHLIQGGADVNAKMKGDLTPLHLAAFYSYRPVSQTLIEAGADIEAKDACLRTPLHLAANSTEDSGEYTLECLIGSNAAVNVADKCGLTPLHLAASKGLANMLFAHMEDLMEIPTSGVHQGITPVHLATMRNMAKPLLPLAKEIKKKAETVTKKNGALDRPLFTCTDVKNRIPLHYAMKYGYIEPMTILLSQSSAEVCLSWRDRDGGYPFDFSSHGFSERLINCLSLISGFPHVSDYTPLHFAAANGKNNCLEWVLQKFSGISVNRKDSRGRTCGMLSLTAKSGPYWPLILKSNLEQRDSMGRGYLHRAAYLRNRNVLLKVLEKCNPNTRDINGVTPLHVAAAIGEQDTVAILLKFGANPFVKDNRGFTPVDWAAAYNQVSDKDKTVVALMRNIWHQ
uniref:ANK_REP_REGION domain-containing protein n=1 Tax=Angiostrongylus cantonensis TaxID=6313 RepID=A0A0K0DJP8_ANGCA